MYISITKKDILWSYLAQFFNLATGLITLPLILSLLTPDEVGFNYILVSINSIVALFDMGFSSQFAKYLTYVFSGAQSIYKEGIPDEYSNEVNEHLIASIIVSAKKIYFYISLIAFVCLITFGSWYIYNISDGFSIIDNTLIIWVVFCISSFFNVYFLYFNAFLLGKGLVKETKQAQVLSRILQILITFVMLVCGCGLLSVVVANLFAPFIFRLLAYNKFYTDDIIKIIRSNEINSAEIKGIFNILLHNCKKLGVIGVLSSAIGYASTLIVGKYMTLSEVGSYGLMVQLVGVVMGLATIHFNSVVPEFASLMIMKNTKRVSETFGLSMFYFITISILGLIGLSIAPPIFRFLNFNTQLPNFSIVLVYYIYKFFEQNQSLYSHLFLIKNDLRFYPSAVITGVVSFVALWISLYLGFGIMGVVIAQAIPLFLYSAWKWPLEATIYFSINKDDILLSPLKSLYSKIHG